MDKSKWIVLDKQGNEIKLPAKCKDFRGKVQIVSDFYPPAHEGSTGRVETKTGGLYYPSVFDLTLVRKPD